MLVKLRLKEGRGIVDAQTDLIRSAEMLKRKQKLGAVEYDWESKKRGPILFAIQDVVARE